MKLTENMTLSELEAEEKMQLRRIAFAQASLDKIHEKKDHSDELAKHFHLGKVGFRKDTKKQNKTLDRAIDKGVKACRYYETINESNSRIRAILQAVHFITENKTYGETVRQIKENRRKATLASAKDFTWEKVAGHYGTAYQCGGFVVERVDSGFVAIRDTKGMLLSHCKTVKEAKNTVSIAISDA